MSENKLTKILYQKNSPANTGYVELVNYMGSDVITPVNAARASFGVQINSLTERDQKLYKYCVREGHTSILEHNTLTFAIKTPLFVARQHMRHRTWSYNEISRRYTDKDLDFYMPINFRQQSESNRQASISGSEQNPVLHTIEGTTMDYTCKADEALQTHVANSLKLYNQMIEAGVAREQARMVLPQNLYTHYWATVNLNNFFKFCDLRIHEGAQEEIQDLAIACKELASEVWPLTFSLYNLAKDEKKSSSALTYFKSLNTQEKNNFIKTLQSL